MRCSARSQARLASGPQRASRPSAVDGFNDEVGADGLYLRSVHGKPCLKIAPPLVAASATCRVARCRGLPRGVACGAAAGGA
eukprot:9045358-Pyramimonas_sp.AAC.1